MDLGLGIVVSLRDMLSRNAGRVESAMDSLDDTVARASENMSRNLDRIQKGTMMVGAGLAMLAAPVALLAATADTQRALGELASLGVQDLRALEDAAESFTNTWSGTTKAQFIESAYDVRSALSNLSDDAVGTFTAMAALAAKATKATTDEMVGTFTTSYGIYKPIMQDMSDMEWARTFAGAMAQTVASFKTNGKQMSDAIKNIGAVASSSNIPLEEQLAILGQLQTTMPGSEAGTLYKAFIMKAAEAGQKLGVSLVGTDGRLKGIVPMLKEIKKRFPDLSKAATQVQIKKAFGSDEAVKFLLQMSQGMDALETNIVSVRTAMQTGTAVTEQMAQAMNSDIGANWQVIRQQVANLAEILGRTLLPVVAPITRAISQVVLFLQRTAKTVPGLTRAVLTITIALGGFLVVAGGLVTSIGAIGIALPAIKAGIAGFGAALAGVGSAIATYIWPVTAIIAGVVLAVYLLRKAWEHNFGGIRDLIEGVVGKIQLAFQGVHGLISSLRDGSGTLSADLARDLKAAGLMGFVTTIFQLYYRIREYYSGLGSALGDAFGRISEILSPAIQSLVSAFSTLFSAYGSIFEIFGIVSTGPDASSYRTLGETIGTILGVVAQVGAYIIKFVIYPLAFVIKLVGYVVGAVVWLVKTITKGVVLAAKALYTFFLPLRLVVQGLRLVGRVAYALWQVFSGDTSAVSGMKAIGHAVFEFLTTPFRWLRDTLRGFWTAFRGLFSGVGTLIQFFGDALVSGLKAIPIFGTLFQIFDLTNLLSKGPSFFEAGKNWIMSLGDGIWSAITYPIRMVKKGLSQLKGVLSLFGNEKDAVAQPPSMEAVQPATQPSRSAAQVVESSESTQSYLQRALQWGGRVISMARSNMGSLIEHGSQRVAETARVVRDRVQAGFGAVARRLTGVLQALRQPVTLKISDAFSKDLASTWDAFQSGLMKRFRAGITVAFEMANTFKRATVPIAAGALAMIPAVAQSQWGDADPPEIPLQEISVRLVLPDIPERFHAHLALSLVPVKDPGKIMFEVSWLDGIRPTMSSRNSFSLNMERNRAVPVLNQTNMVPMQEAGAYLPVELASSQAEAAVLPLDMVPKKPVLQQVQRISVIPRAFPILNAFHQKPYAKHLNDFKGHSELALSVPNTRTAQHDMVAMHHAVMNQRQHVAPTVEAIRQRLNLAPNALEAAAPIRARFGDHDAASLRDLPVSIRPAFGDIPAVPTLTGSAMIRSQFESMSAVTVPDANMMIQPALGNTPNVPNLTRSAMMDSRVGSLPEMNVPDTKLVIQPLFDNPPNVPVLTGSTSTHSYVANIPDMTVPKSTALFQPALGNAPAIPTLTGTAMVRPHVGGMPAVVVPVGKRLIHSAIGNMPNVPIQKGSALIRPYFESMPDMTALDGVAKIQSHFASKPAMTIPDGSAMVRPHGENMPAMVTPDGFASIRLALSETPNAPNLNGLAMIEHPLGSMPVVTIPDGSAMIKPEISDMPALSALTGSMMMQPDASDASFVVETPGQRPTEPVDFGKADLLASKRPGQGVKDDQAQVMQSAFEYLARKIDQLEGRPISITVKTEIDGREIAEVVYRDIIDQKVKNYETL